MNKLLSQTYQTVPSSFSFGCSDLHGDGRVHEQTGPEGPSGFGFELTMRLKREEGEKSPPTWPAAIMQALAKYVFQSGLETHIKLALCIYFQTVNVANLPTTI